MFRRALLVLPAAALLLAAAPARACDIKIHDAALNEWPRAYYLLYLVHSNAKPLTAAQEDLPKRLREKHFAEVNADVVKLNLDGSMLREDREFLSAQGCNGWPQVVILGKDGKEVVRTSGPLEKKDFTRLGERVGELSPGARALVLAPKSDEKAWKAAGEVSAEALAAVGLKDLKPELLDTGDAANKELAARYAPPALPAMFLVSPRGSLLASYPGEVKEAELLKAFDSPARKDLTKALEKAAIAFIFVPGKDKKASSAAADRLKTAVKRGEKLFGIKIARLEVATGDRDEAVFLKNLEVQSGPAVVAVFGKGKRLEPLDGKFLEDDILERAGFMIQNCTCVLNPDALGEDLLLKWKGVDQRVKMQR